MSMLNSGNRALAWRKAWRRIERIMAAKWRGENNGNVASAYQ